jgi:LacI family transcriptional regulator
MTETDFESRESPKRVQIRDVAERAGVSPATASRALNGDAKVAARAKVLRAAAELGYRPNRLARNLRRQTADTVGIVVSDIENPHFAETVRAAEDAMFRRGYRAILCNTDESAEKQQAYLEKLVDERVSGVILTPTNPTDEEIGTLLDLGIPVVAMDRPVADPRADAVLANNVDAGRLATSHLLELGHTRIGFVSGPVSTRTGDDRLTGYESAMRRAALEPKSECGLFRVDGGRVATERLLDDTDARLTALVVANNQMAVGALQVIRERRIKVPGDLAFVLIDEPNWVTFFDPSLTSLAQPIRAMTDSAVQLLFDRLDPRTREQVPSSGRRLLFDLELHVRDSSAPPTTDRSSTSAASGRLAGPASGI